MERLAYGEVRVVMWMPITRRTPSGALIALLTEMSGSQAYLLSVRNLFIR